MNLPAIERRPRLLWVNAFCLMDLSSGASMAVRQMLIQLVGQGYEVEILGATVFDAESGRHRLASRWEAIQASDATAVTLEDPPLRHRLVKTASIERGKMTAQEEERLLALYRRSLDRFRPDIVFFYGGRVLDMQVADEAHSRGIPCVAYLANGNYRGTRWCRDVDLILTDSRATAARYRSRLGIVPRPVGAFIDPRRVVAAHHERRRILVVNPLPEKGGVVVAMLALLMERRRPDIVFEVVESRGRWQPLLEKVSAQLGAPRQTLTNVVVTSTTQDMRPLYGRARLLLALSLVWESFARVGVEAMLNGIPAVVSRSGGLPEAVGSGGLCVDFPDSCHRPPYASVPGREWLETLIQHLERFYDDKAYYHDMVTRAQQQADRHQLATSTERLCSELSPLVARRAGDRCEDRRRNKQLVTAVLPPEVTEGQGEKVLVHSLIGGPRSMGRVGEALLSHLVHRARYRAYVAPFASDDPVTDWPSWARQRIVHAPERTQWDQQIAFCSVREPTQRRIARRLTPWFFHDLDCVPKELVRQIDRNDTVYACSPFVRDVLVDSGVQRPVQLLGLGFNPDYFSPRERPSEGPMTFLCVAEHTPRKNLPALISAFERAFRPNDDVRLIIKLALHGVGDLAGYVTRHSQIHLMTRLFEGDAEMAALYHQAHCFVLPTRTEGFGLPVLEAMATGLPVIVTNYSGHLAFCDDDNALLLRHRGNVVADPSAFPYLKGSWVEPDEDHLVHLLRQVYHDYSSAQRIGQRAYDSVKDEWTWSRQLSKVFPEAL